MAKITVSYLRDLEKKCDKGEISFSRMVELLNERAFDASGEVPKDCILKADILAHLDEMTEGANEQENAFKEAEMEISELTSGVMKIAYQIVKNWVVRQDVAATELNLKSPQ